MNATLSLLLTLMNPSPLPVLPTDLVFETGVSVSCIATWQPWPLNIIQGTAMLCISKPEIQGKIWYGVWSGE